MKFHLQDWVLQCDVEATRIAYEQIPAGDADRCTCSYCRNYRLLREVVFPDAVQQFLSSMGIDWRREAEVTEYTREDSGLHFYNGWLHFIGAVETVGTPVQVNEQFSLDFSETQAPMFPQFKGKPTVVVDFSTSLPWVLEA